jgi:hypothetical protein
MAAWQSRVLPVLMSDRSVVTTAMRRSRSARRSGFPHTLSNDSASRRNA